MRLFKVGPKQPVAEGERTVDLKDQGMENASQMSGTSEGCPLKDEPPYFPECEVFEVGGPEASQAMRKCVRRCEKNFIPVKEFAMGDLPEGCQDEETFQEIKRICSWTVKLEVNYTSVNRPDTIPDSTLSYPYVEYRGRVGITRTGTGLILPASRSSWITDTECPCHKCKFQELGMPKNGYFSLIVLTAAHVVFDDAEAGQTVCELFDDDPDDKANVKLMYGIKEADMKWRFGDEALAMVGTEMYKVNDMGNLKKRPRLDLFVLECVSHDMELYNYLKSFLKDWNYFLFSLPLIVSHPHGCSKMIGVGTFGEVRIQLSKTHTTNDTPYTIPVDTRVDTEIDLMTLYSDLFEKDQNPKERWFKYNTTQPLHMYIPCDASNTAIFKYTEGPVHRHSLPAGSRLCSVDGTTDIPGDGLGFYGSTLFVALQHDDISYHIVYDTHTCKGSSGACLLRASDYWHSYQCHYGKMAGGSLNRSGAYTPFY